MSRFLAYADFSEFMPEARKNYDNARPVSIGISVAPAQPKIRGAIASYGGMP
jgi:hypothetical protein